MFSSLHLLHIHSQQFDSPGVVERSFATAVILLQVAMVSPGTRLVKTL